MNYLNLAVCSVAGLLLPLAVAAQKSAKTASSRPKAPTETIAVLAPAAPAAPKKAVAARPLVKTLTGYVLNEEGEPLAGATIISEKGEVITTNADGQFMIQSTAATPVLRASYAGYQELQMPINTLQPTTFRLDPIEDYERQLKKQSRAAAKALKH